MTSSHTSQVDLAQAQKCISSVAAALVLLAAWNLYRGHLTIAAVLGALSGSLLVIRTCFPSVACHFHTGWMALAATLGYVNSRIILTLIHYGLITPFGLVMRIAGRDSLNRRDRPSPSYWVLRKTTKQTRERFKRLF